MGAALILIAWLGLVFTDTVECRVFGLAYVAPDAPASFVREDGCRLIRDTIHEHLLTLSTEHWVVDIPLPAMHGHTALSYQWGSSQAYLKGEAWPVAWSRVVRS